MTALSFVIPAFNAARTIAAAILSAQRTDPADIIVVDDGSSDDTADVARSLGVRVIQQRNAGPAAARRRGLAEVGVDATILLDADDEVVVPGVKRSVAILAGGNNCVAVVGGTLARPKSGQPYQLPLWNEGIDARSLILRGHAPAPPAAITFRTDALRAAFELEPPGVWPAFAEDYEVLIRVALSGVVLAHSDIAANYWWIGGRSSTAIREEISDARLIARHYRVDAGLAPIDVPSASWRRDTASLALRRAAECSARLIHPERLAWTLLGVGLDPARLLRAVSRKTRGVARARGGAHCRRAAQQAVNLFKSS